MPISEWPDFTVLEQNEDYVVIAKAPGVDVHRDEEEPGIPDKVAKYLGLEKLYLVHRLDKVTSGVMVLAMTSETCASLAALFKARRVDKFYLAVSGRKPKKKQGWVIGDMERSRRGSWKLTSGKNNPAVTQFFSKPLQPGFRAFLLKPRTGKTHQLRVALKSIGSPICGDFLYEDTAKACTEERTYLHAYVLSFYWQGQQKYYRFWPKHGEHFCSASFAALKGEWENPESLDWPGG